MASAFTHVVVSTALGSMMLPRRWRLIALGAIGAVLPDADVLAFSFGIPYAHVLGHRGLSHSLVFAASWAALLTWTLARRQPPPPSTFGSSPPDRQLSVLRIAAYLFLATASHGLLDALTDGGLGIAFFAPFSNDRYFFPWRPIAVSPISVRRFFSERGLAVLANELVVVWVPAFALSAVGILWRRRVSERGPPPQRS